MSSPIVSVITPVRNGAAFLAETIESVRHQTFQDWEYLIIDNASDDSTADVANDLAAGDPRIRVIRYQEFVGIYANHNRGLRASHPDAKYIKFIHADDWMFPECLEKMVGVADDNPSVGVVGAYRLREREVGFDSIPWGQVVTPGRTILRQALLGGPYVTGSPSSLLMRRDLLPVGEDFYDETYWHSDTEAAYRLLAVSDFGFVHQVLTFTRVHEDSNTPYSERVSTYAPENIRMLLELGPRVLSRQDYRRQLRRELRQYAWFLLKQRLKPSRRSDDDFFEFHSGVLDRVLSTDLPDCSATDAAVLKACRRLLYDPARSAARGARA